nr:MAG TPA: hypothetical protein [Caudoviricetes sp.]
MDEAKMELQPHLGDLTLVLVKFGLNFTEDELRAVYFEPHSKLAVKTKQYVYKCIKEAAKKYLIENYQIEEDCNN